MSFTVLFNSQQSSTELVFAGLPLSIKQLSAERGYAERQEVMGCGDKNMLVRAEIKPFLPANHGNLSSGRAGRTALSGWGHAAGSKIALIAEELLGPRATGHM